MAQRSRNETLKYIILGCPTLGKFSKTDEKRIEQKVRILLDNAIKYSNEGGTVLINVKTNQNHKEIIGTIISITDNGRGIKEEDLTKIFDSFYRGSDVDNIEGSGLGLFIANEIVDLHQGKLFFESVWKKGSTFNVIFPNETSTQTIST